MHVLRAGADRLTSTAANNLPTGHLKDILESVQVSLNCFTGLVTSMHAADMRVQGELVLEVLVAQFTSDMLLRSTIGLPFACGCASFPQ